MMRRLNTVLTQLDAATEEKRNIEVKLKSQIEKVVELEKQLENGHSSKENFDGNLQQEITYERELNSKMNRDIKKYEHERDMLKDRLKEQDLFKKQLSSDTNKLTTEYSQKSKELQNLETSFVTKQSFLTNLERELESLRNYQKFSKDEKSRLEEEIERLSIVKKRLISKDHLLNIFVI